MFVAAVGVPLAVATVVFLVTVINVLVSVVTVVVFIPVAAAAVVPVFPITVKFRFRYFSVTGKIYIKSKLT